MKATKENFEPICDYVCDTATKIESNHKASEELRAATDEFKEKSMELRQNFSDDILEQSIAEVEQAADSALRVARASETPKSLTSQLERAHDKVRDFKDACAS